MNELKLVQCDPIILPKDEGAGHYLRKNIHHPNNPLFRVENLVEPLVEAVQAPQVIIKEPLVPLAQPVKKNVPIRAPLIRDKSDSEDEEEEEEEEAEEVKPNNQYTDNKVLRELGIADADIGVVNPQTVARKYTAASMGMKKYINDDVIPRMCRMLNSPGMEQVKEANRIDTALYAVLSGWGDMVRESPELLHAAEELAPKGVAVAIKIVDKVNQYLNMI